MGVVERDQSQRPPEGSGVDLPVGQKDFAQHLERARPKHVREVSIASELHS